MGRGGCNCCGDWCTTAHVGRNGGLSWIYNYGDDCSHVATIGKNIYTAREPFISNWGPYVDEAVRKTPYRSSHNYETVKSDQNNWYWFFFKKLNEHGKLMSSKYVYSDYMYSYPYYWYGWSPYNGTTDVHSTINHMYITSAKDIAYTENPEFAKYVKTNVLVDGTYQEKSNWSIGWDLYPSYSYGTINSLFGYYDFWNSFGPLSYSLGFAHRKSKYYNDNTVVMGSESSYDASYYSSNQFNNNTLKLIGVDSEMLYFKLVGAINLTKYLDDTKYENVTNVEHTYNDDATLSIQPITGLIHNYDSDQTLPNPTVNAKPFIVVNADLTFTIYDTDLTDAFAQTPWAGMKPISCYFSEGKVEFNFSLPNSYVTANGSTQTLDPENWLGQLGGFSALIRYTYTTTWTQNAHTQTGITQLHKSGSTVITMPFTQGMAYSQPVWDTSFSSIVCPITGYDSMESMYPNSPTLVVYDGDSIEYHDVDIRGYVTKNPQDNIIDVNDINYGDPVSVTVPVSTNEELTQVIADFNANPGAFLGFEFDGDTIGTTLEFTRTDAPEYIFNKVGYDNELYAVVTVNVTLKKLKYAVQSSYEFVYLDADNDEGGGGGDEDDKLIAVTFTGNMISVTKETSYQSWSYVLQFNDNYSIRTGYTLDSYVSNILKYDGINYTAIRLARSNYYYGSEYIYNYIGNNLGLPWNFYTNTGYAFANSVDFIDRVNGNLQIVINEQFRRDIFQNSTSRIIDEGKYNGIFVPMVTNNAALPPTKSVIIRDDDGALYRLLTNVVGTLYSAKVYNSAPSDSMLRALVDGSTNVVTVNSEGYTIGGHYVPNIQTIQNDGRGNIVVGAISSSNRVMMTTGTTYITSTEPIDFSEAIRLMKLQGTVTQERIDAILAYEDADHMVPVECIYLMADFISESIKDSSESYVVEINGVQMTFPLDARSNEITTILNENGFPDVIVTGGPLLLTPICIANLHPEDFTELISTIEVNDSLGKFRAGLGFWPSDFYDSTFSTFSSLNPERFSKDYNTLLWSFNSTNAEYIYFYDNYPWWAINNGWTGFFNNNIYNNLMVQFGIDNGYPIQIQYDGTLWSPDGKIDDYMVEFNQLRTKLVAPLYEQQGFVSPFFRFMSDDKERVSWNEPLTQFEYASRLKYPEMLDRDTIFNVGANLSSLFHGGVMCRVRNNKSKIYSKPKALYQIKSDGTIGWTSGFDYQARNNRVDGVTVEENQGFSGRVADMTLSEGGEVYIATNMVNLGESKPDAYSSYSEYFNSEIRNRIDVRHAGKAYSIANNVNGQYVDGNGVTQDIEERYRTTVIYDAVGKKDTGVVPKARNRLTDEIAKIVRT